MTLMHDWFTSVHAQIKYWLRIENWGIKGSQCSQDKVICCAKQETNSKMWCSLVWPRLVLFGDVSVVKAARMSISWRQATNVRRKGNQRPERGSHSQDPWVMQCTVVFFHELAVSLKVANKTQTGMKNAQGVPTASSGFERLLPHFLEYTHQGACHHWSFSWINEMQCLVIPQHASPSDSKKKRRLLAVKRTGT